MKKLTDMHQGEEGIIRRVVTSACGSCSGCSTDGGTKSCPGCMPDGGFKNMGVMWEMV